MRKPIKLQTPSEDKTEFENFEELARKLINVDKDEFDALLLKDKRNKKKNKSKPLEAFKETS